MGRGVWKRGSENGAEKEGLRFGKFDDDGEGKRRSRNGPAIEGVTL